MAMPIVLCVFMKIAIVIFSLFWSLSVCDPSVAMGDVGEPEETPTYVYVTGVILGGADLISLLGNTTGLLKHDPSRTYGYLGVVGGALSVAFAFILAEERPSHESASILFGLSGGLAFGLGVFSLRSPGHADEVPTTLLRIGPTVFESGGRCATGIFVSCDF